MHSPIETIKAFHSRRDFGTRFNLRAAQQEAAAAYRSLSPTECRTLAEFALATGDENILAHLACFQPGSLAELHTECVQRGLLYPPQILHGANQQTADLLIRQLEDGSAENINMLLLALAWAGNSTVVDAFRRWQSVPPAWSESLYVPPSEYAQEAGWELTADGNRRDLILHACRPLVPPDHPDAIPDVVGVNLPNASTCGWCARRMTVLFDFDLTSELLSFLGIEGTRLRVQTCDVCTCYGMLFTQVDWHGSAGWHPANERPDYLPDNPDDWPTPIENALHLSRRQRPVTESACRNMPISFSQVGGHPSWEQDAEYPRCPSCQQTMFFIAQLSNEDFDDAEGIYYAFVCRACQTAATHYQQT